MRAVFGAAPAWVSSVVQGVIFFVSWTLYAWFAEHVTWWHALVVGLAFSALMTVAMWFVERRQRGRLAEITRSLDREQRTAAFRAAQDGPIPDDPAVRRAAAGIASAGLDQSMRGRGLGGVTIAVILLISVIAAVQSPWYAVGAVALAALSGWTWLEPRRLERRLDTLLAAERAQARAQWSRPGSPSAGLAK